MPFRIRYRYHNSDSNAIYTKTITEKRTKRLQLKQKPEEVKREYFYERAWNIPPFLFMSNRQRVSNLGTFDLVRLGDTGMKLYVTFSKKTARQNYFPDWRSYLESNLWLLSFRSVGTWAQNLMRSPSQHAKRLSTNFLITNNTCLNAHDYFPRGARKHHTMIVLRMARLV